MNSLLADPVHEWNDQQRLILKNLWINSLQNRADESNRFVNNPAATELGHRIFFDKRFSANGEIACASCHLPDKYFTDGLATGKGIKTVNRNTPTVVGASQFTWLFHDGRADSLWAQATGPLENELEHGGNRAQFAHLVYNDETLRGLYEKLFGPMPDLGDTDRFPVNAGPVKDATASGNWKAMSKQDQQTITDIFVKLAKAIAAYETLLQPAASRFDHYVEALINNRPGELDKHLSNQEVKGLRIFIDDAKCITCHSGPLFTDMGFHNISVQPPEGRKHDEGRMAGAREVIDSPFNCRSKYNDAHTENEQQRCDELKYMVMDRHETQGAMKTPSLRNIAKTAPYMHAGQYKTLRDVLKHYNDPPPVKFRLSELFLQVDLNEYQFDALEAFLKSLDSPIAADERWLQPPSN